MECGNSLRMANLDSNLSPVDAKRPSVVPIDPNALYHAYYLKTTLGRRCYESILKSGLRKCGGWYLGEEILRCMKISLDSPKEKLQHEQVVTFQRRERQNHGTTRQKKANPVEENPQRRDIHAVSAYDGCPDLRSQIAAFRRKNQKAI